MTTRRQQQTEATRALRARRRAAGQCIDCGVKLGEPPDCPTRCTGCNGRIGAYKRAASGGGYPVPTFAQFERMDRGGRP